MPFFKILFYFFKYGLVAMLGALFFFFLERPDARRSHKS